MVSRRAFLTTGAATVLVAGFGAAGYAQWPGNASAIAPWAEAGNSFGDARLDALAYAILAPNPHNRQPWMFELVGETQIDIYCDLSKRLPHTDPLNRQITVGFGCMLELLRMAGAEAGYDVQIAPFPDGEPQPVLNGNRIAQVTFVKGGAEPDPLFAAVLDRRSTKETFDTAQPVGADLLARVAAAGQHGEISTGHTAEIARTSRIINLAWDGFMIEYETARTRRESIDLMRIGNRAIAKNPDGIDLGGTVMGLMNMTGIVTKEGLDTPGSTAYNQGIKMYEPMIKSAQGFAWLTAPANTRISQLEAGRSWVRVNLAAQAEGLCIHPLSQILQEFPEMAVPYRAIHEELGMDTEGVVHMLGRVGYTKFPAPSPRWPMESKLIDASA